jgi:hypothetical protein
LNPFSKETSISTVSRLFELGIHKPVAALLAACLIVTFFMGLDSVIVWIIVFLAIFTVMRR